MSYCEKCNQKTNLLRAPFGGCGKLLCCLSVFSTIFNPPQYIPFNTSIVKEQPMVVKFDSLLKIMVAPLGLILYCWTGLELDCKLAW